MDSTWATDANGKPNISATVTTYDPGKTYAKAKRTEQDIDVFGNMTQMRLFDWGAGTSRRVYSNTYLNAAPYASLAAGNVYIKNRLLTSSYSENGGTPVTLATNTYDNYAVGCVGLWNGCAMIATTGARQKDPAYTTSFTLRGNLANSVKYGAGGTAWMAYLSMIVSTRKLTISEKN